MTENQLRHRMRQRARERQRKEGVSFSRALFLVRRSEILKYLFRQVPRSVSYEEIARETAVPIGTVRQICQNLKRRGELPQTPGETGGAT